MMSWQGFLWKINFYTDASNVYVIFLKMAFAVKNMSRAACPGVTVLPVQYLDVALYLKESKRADTLS